MGVSFVDGGCQVGSGRWESRWEKFEGKARNGKTCEGRQDGFLNDRVVASEGEGDGDGDGGKMQMQRKGKKKTNAAATSGEVKLKRSSRMHAEECCTNQRRLVVERRQMEVRSAN